MSVILGRLERWIMDMRAMSPGQMRIYKGKAYVALNGTCNECAFGNTGCYSFRHKVVLGCCIKNHVCFKEVGCEESQED